GHKYHLSFATLARYSDVIFFFQAQDGIRDRNVTGVQTCALPIWPISHMRSMNPKMTNSRLFSTSSTWTVKKPLKSAKEMHYSRCPMVISSSLIKTMMNKT